MKVKYDKIGIDYNSTRKADPFLTNKFIKHLSPIKDGIYLDIGCGTGNYTNELEKNGLQLIGIDPSERMLGKAKCINKNVDWRIGTVESIELSDNSVDGVIGSLTIHHWTNLQKGFSELNRVLKPDGRIVIFTSTPEQMRGYWLNHYFPKMMVDSIDKMPGLEKVEEAMTKSKIAIMEIDKYFIQPDLQDKFLYCGKQNPELYFNEQIRNGISSFSYLANKTEVEQGLIKLRNDIKSGKINEIIDSYDNDSGHYLFIIGKKPAEC
ncbi:MAG: class I SAM-dependent methyltransferase [Eudoraea sp.]|nr:class I SAM-dependent methyltransferase [Eudoraea sp.]